MAVRDLGSLRKTKSRVHELFKPAKELLELVLLYKGKASFADKQTFKLANKDFLHCLFLDCHVCGPVGVGTVALNLYQTLNLSIGDVFGNQLQP